MAMIPWSERGALATLRPDLESWMDQFFRNGFETSRLPAALKGSLPPVNLAETDKEFVAMIELPGMEEKDIDIQVLGEQLVISGERKWEQEQKDRQYYRVESQYGTFRRVVELPEGLVTDPDSIQASFAKGVLEVRIPKMAPKPVAKIKIKHK
jgi:HSP20 family protein